MSLAYSGLFNMEEKNLTTIIGILRTFLIPPVSAIANKMDFKRWWSAGGPWKSS